MATVKRFEELQIWQMARQLENLVFSETEKSDLARDYNLKNQMIRSAGSVMDNIAEGFGRASRLEFIQFLSIAKGSVNELQSQLYRCLDRKYIPKALFIELYNRTELLCSKITAFMNYLNKSAIKGQKFSGRKLRTE